ncbi:hypothetical protein VitviT2T_022629 [Vitis vinifera]|uniref:RecF/RecN/SMC N-terminal domain-containing protein n=2 Tax=Vitis vinifera TaxID=29760 RepID=D7SXA9_VITVI
MDEIDAALDFKNVSIVGHYVKDRTNDAQFIIISLRNNMFELVDRLVGIYKTDNCTKSITINPGSFVVCEKNYLGSSMHHSILGQTFFACIDAILPHKCWSHVYWRMPFDIYCIAID